MKKIEKFEVRGVLLNASEKALYEKLQEVSTIDTTNIEEVALDLKRSIPSIRSGLARLDKTHGLAKSQKVLINDKVLTRYKKD